MNQNNPFRKKNRRNAFLALCDVASKQNWCWKIACGTCGHSGFRAAFSKIIRGEHPDDDNFWENGKSDHDLYLQINKYNDFKMGRARMQAQKKLQDVVMGAKITDLMQVASFPDWLGYLGLVLFHTSDEEKENGQLTKAWIPQFLGLLPADSPASVKLKEILLKNGRLESKDLEMMEFALDENK